MLRKRVWIPVLSFILCIVAGYFLWRQLPQRELHNTPAKRMSVNDNWQVARNSLQWLQRHQSNDGRWSVNYYQFYCDDHDEYTESVYRSDIAYTSLAILAYLGSGYDHKTPAPYGEAIPNAVSWLLRQQGLSGVFSDDNYQQALATMALCEAYAMTMDPVLKEPAQRAVDIVQECLLVLVSGDQVAADSILTTWQVMALKAAKNGGLEVGSVWNEMKEYYEPIPWKVNSKSTEDLLSMVFLGMGRESKQLQSAIAIEVQKTAGPLKELNPQKVYMTALLALVQGDSWERFDQHRERIIPFFNTGTDCRYASMDPHIFLSASRFESTVFMCLIFEVQQRYRRVKRKKK